MLWWWHSSSNITRDTWWHVTWHDINISGNSTAPGSNGRVTGSVETTGSVRVTGSVSGSVSPAWSVTARAPSGHIQHSDSPLCQTNSLLMCDSLLLSETNSLLMWNMEEDVAQWLKRQQEKNVSPTFLHSLLTLGLGLLHLDVSSLLPYLRSIKCLMSVFISPLKYLD